MIDTNQLRLMIFDLWKGNAVGLRALARYFGWRKALLLGMQIQWRLKHSHPFAEINRARQPGIEERLSQQQMAPIVLLYQVLMEDGMSRDQALDILEDVTEAVAIAFLRFTLPEIRPRDLDHALKNADMSLMKKLTSRFFNATTHVYQADAKTVAADVTHCHFASYCRELQMPELGYLFCRVDDIYFRTYQPHMVFFRSRTLANSKEPCDFRFRARAS